ncbi:MAG: hypothetical protein IPG35_09175 [Flavobacteriales bacterium]|mgnify:FL=1|nr:hypothetical protein [Flavobacteriales bacterium]
MKRPTPTTASLKLNWMVMLFSALLIHQSDHCTAQYTVYNTTSDSWDVAIKYDGGNQSSITTCAPGMTLITTVFDIIEVRVFCFGDPNDPVQHVKDECTGRIFASGYTSCTGYEVGVDFSHCLDPGCQYFTCDDRECTIFIP